MDARSTTGRSLRPKLDDTETLLKAVVRERVVNPRSNVLCQGDVPRLAHILLDGHTCRYRLLSDGRRQITAILMPGDICDLEAVMRGRADYSVGALTRCVLGEIPTERVAISAGSDPEMTQALWRRLLRDQAIAREWLVGMGQRTALERVAYLLCELRFRLEGVGMASGAEFEMPLTQVELADALGLSPVHINRTLRELRTTGLIRLATGTLTILDISVLELVAGFDPAYLCLA